MDPPWVEAVGCNVGTTVPVGSVQHAEPETGLLQAILLVPLRKMLCPTTQNATQCGTSGDLGCEIHPIPALPLGVCCCVFACGWIKQIMRAVLRLCSPSDLLVISLFYLTVPGVLATGWSLDCHLQTAAGLSDHCNTTPLSLLLPFVQRSPHTLLLLACLLLFPGICLLCFILSNDFLSI